MLHSGITFFLLKSITKSLSNKLITSVPFEERNSKHMNIFFCFF